MNRKTFLDAADDASVFDDPDFNDAPWSLDELDGSGDLGSVRSAWAGSADGAEFPSRLRAPAFAF